MKSNSLKSGAWFLAFTVVAMAACGGSTDDEAGAPGPLAVVPTSLTQTNGSPTCDVAAGSDPTVVYIKGGTAPYVVESSEPARVVVSPARVLNRGESFTVSFQSGCVNPASVVVTDSLNAHVVFTAIHAFESPASAP